VFRGSDVKDIKIAEEEKENKPPEPQNVLNDPAIVVSNKLPFACGPRAGLRCRPSLSITFYDEIFRMLITDLFRKRKLLWKFSVAFLLIVAKVLLILERHELSTSN